MSTKKTTKPNIDNPLAVIQDGLTLLIDHACHKSFKETVSVTPDQLVTPPNTSLGDLALPCFSLAKKLGQSPAIIATTLATEIDTLITQSIKNRSGEFFEKSIVDSVNSAGPYLNFTLNSSALAQITIEASGRKNYGHSNNHKGKTMVIDMSSPNIAKPLGIGHLRSAIIGNAITKLYQTQGYKTIKINYLGDWGKQFGKVILGWEKWGSEKKLSQNPMQHLYELYVKVSADELLDTASKEVFKKLEDGDRKTLALWKKFYNVSLKDFKKIYKLLGVTFDVYSGESHYNSALSKIVADLEKKKLLTKSEGARIVDLTKYDLGVCIIEKSDGTSTYATRDIAAAIDRQKKYKFDTMLYEVGAEQKLHLAQVFKILELMGYSWAKQCTHIDHGLYLGTDGKKFSTRRGKSVFVEDVLNEIIDLAAKEITKRQKLSKPELAKRAHAIAISALLYGDLKNNRQHDSIFDIERFLSFDGNTGPYLLYTYARLRSIIKKSKDSKTSSKEYNWLEEKNIVLTLAHYPEVLRTAQQENDPSHLAKYLHKLAQDTSEYYHKTPVLNTEKNIRSNRLMLIKNISSTLKNGLDILGIQTLEQM